MRHHYYQNFIKSRLPFGSPLIGRTFEGDEKLGYKFGFNGKEKDDEINVDCGSYDFGARIYDGRLGRWLSLDPLQAKYPNISPYNSFENNPIYFVDLDGKDAEAKISGNTITISTTVFIFNAGSTKAKAAQMQKQIMGVWGGENGKGFKYTAEDGKVYNVKFDIKVEPMCGINQKDPKCPSVNDNIVSMVDKPKDDFRSYVKDGNIGTWSENESGETYAHEVGHFLGFDDGYADILCNTNLNPSTKAQSVRYESCPHESIMGTGSKVTSKEVDAIAKLVLSTQKNGVAEIKASGAPLNKPTAEDLQTISDYGCEVVKSE